jgi:LacI family transcriptional regulator
MRLGKTLAVGCILSDIRQPVAAAMVTAAETVLREAGYAMIVASTHFDDAREAEILAFMRDRAVDGLLMIVNHDSDPATVKRLKALNIPIVLWERDGGGVLDTVVSEHREGLRQATRHLIELGHKNILLIAANPTTRVGREQAGGFADAFAEAGKRPPRHSVFHTEEFDAPKPSSKPRFKDRTDQRQSSPTSTMFLMCSVVQTTWG